MKMARSFRLVLDEKKRVSDFVAAQVGGADWGGYEAIGIEKGGELVAGIVYDGFYGPNVNMHVGALPGRLWVTRDVLFSVFAYPFLQLKCDRITGAVPSWNKRAIAFDEHVGFEYETRLKGAVPYGDLLIYVMWKDQCRWLNHGLRPEPLIANVHRPCGRSSDQPIRQSANAR